MTLSLKAWSSIFLIPEKRSVPFFCFRFLSDFFSFCVPILFVFLPHPSGSQLPLNPIPHVPFLQFSQSTKKVIFFFSGFSHRKKEKIFFCRTEKRFFLLCSLFCFFPSFSFYFYFSPKRTDDRHRHRNCKP